MRTKSWIHQLSELKDQTICFGKMKPVPPDADTCRFIVSGHIMEYMDVGPGRRLPILFFGPEEFALRSHPVLTCLEVIDDASIEVMKHGTVIRTLRHFPKTVIHYKEIRRLYREKVMERLKLDRMETAIERYHYVRERQNWIFSLVDHRDIAAYLGIKVEEFRELRGKG